LAHSTPENGHAKLATAKKISDPPASQERRCANKLNCRSRTAPHRLSSPGENQTTAATVRVQSAAGHCGGLL
jgi:hypothetical protein